MTLKTLTACLAATGLAVACAPEDGGTGLVALSGDPGEALGFWDCPTWGCSGNAATVGDGIVFDELDGSGVSPNPAGLRIAQVISPAGQPARVRVEGDRLVVQELMGSTSYQGSGVVNTRVILRLPSGQGFRLTVEDHDECPATAKLDGCKLQFWAGPPESVPSYKVVVHREITGSDGQTHWIDRRLLCKGDSVPSGPEWSKVEHRALFFRGDRYDGVEKTVEQTSPQDPWFNVACAGTAMAKMHLLRHTSEGAFPDSSVPGGKQVASVGERQAMLRMLTASYCGGKSFTMNNHPLRYKDSRGWYKAVAAKANGLDYAYSAFDLNDSGKVSSVEAIWGPDGAVCLETPRAATRDDIQSYCKKRFPRCGLLRDWEQRGHVLSVNPPAPRGPPQ